ncbi:V-type proton ATPase subunit S1-like [Tiliqua scincoides]|uniref:V-type proton ATPase subunit S1-like n=1 Tax=Tiliqua scincoides TaxID=71010 RepID=UPI0034624F1E
MQGPVVSQPAWYKRRQLMAVENKKMNDSYPPLKISNGTHTCILFYATNVTLTVNTTVLIDLTNLTFVSQLVNTNLSDCQNTTNAILSLKYTNPVSSIKDLEIRFMMSNKFYEGSARNWFTLDHVWILQDERNISKFNVSKISSPVEYSFHCQLVGTSRLYGATLIPDSHEAKSWDIVISEFQIQAFSTGNDTFSYASDCTTFFTPAIWMALVSSFILLLILTYGIHMVVHLTTNSRFDDPKNAALSVPQTE